MKKFFMFLAVVGLLAFTANIASAQDQPAATDAAATEEVAVEEPVEMTASDLLKGTNQDVPLHQQVKTYFIQGGPGFMSLIVLCLILGLALAIERILYLSFSKTNAKKLTLKIEETLRENGIENGIEKAKDICRNTRGPVASIYYDALNHYDEGLDVVEKRTLPRVACRSASWKTTSPGSLCSSRWPVLGFLGTVVGMVIAFDAIEAAGDISRPSSPEV